jgi:hypothetical protein
VNRWIDRERELISLRNAVGMMAEARRSDAAEYQDMRDLNREMRADALRFRWLTEDHADAAVRERVRSICRSIPTRSLSGARLDIDANMKPNAEVSRPSDLARVGSTDRLGGANEESANG